MNLNVDQALKCLLIQPRFSQDSYWNYVETCELMGAKYPTPPLGMITAAALLPQHWQFRLMDLNTRVFSEADWAWADLVCVGGMIVQKPGILEVIRKANRDGKFVVAGGVDPTSEPDLYTEADALVLGEGELSIPVWIDACRSGQPRGVFLTEGKPDVTTSPIPRYDLLNFSDYLIIGMQYSRGCPFRCEFCDIIELYGRVPRTKTPAQMIRELERLRDLDYRGLVDIVDDNFVGNKKNVKVFLPELIQWSRENRHPFCFQTEASMNLADDEALLSLMQEADFRAVFMGIETPDPELLRLTQKSQNTMKPIVERVHKLYAHGMLVAGGFILGFDNEPSHMDEAMIRCIEDAGICVAMVGLLTALPNTQLTRRLHKEGRLLTMQGELISPDNHDFFKEAYVDSPADQAVAGLNFIPTRQREEILSELTRTVSSLYDPKRYFDRVMRTARMLKTRPKHRPGAWEIRRVARAFYRLIVAMMSRPHLRWLFIRNFFLCLTLRPGPLQQAFQLMALYLHYERHTAYVVENTARRVADRSLSTQTAARRQQPVRSRPAAESLPV